MVEHPLRHVAAYADGGKARAECATNPVKVNVIRDAELPNRLN